LTTTGYQIDTSSLTAAATNPIMVHDAYYAGGRRMRVNVSPKLLNESSNYDGTNGSELYGPIRTTTLTASGLISGTAGLNVSGADTHLTNTAGLNVQLTGDGSTSPSHYVRVVSDGLLQGLPNGYSGVVWEFSQAGDLWLAGQLRQVASDAALKTSFEGWSAWRTSRKLLALYDGTRERQLSDASFAPYAHQPGYNPTLTTSTAVNLAAVSAGNGGSIAIPILVQGHMLIQSVTIWSTDTATARTAEWRLYEDRNDASNSLNEIAALNGTWSFTPSAASARASNAATPGTYLGPGLYWLVIRNTSASQTFGLGSAAASATALGNTGQTKAIAALASTLDFVAATWTKTTAIYGARLDGRVFAGVAAF
jgi:hypothetical protein